MQIFWTNARPADKLTLLFYAPSDTVVNAFANFTLARDYGSFKISLNGKPVSPAINLHNAVLTTQLFPLGKVRLEKGANQLEIEVAGKSPDGEKAFLGLDYLTFN